MAEARRCTQIKFLLSQDSEAENEFDKALYIVKRSIWRSFYKTISHLKDTILTAIYPVTLRAMIILFLGCVISLLLDWSPNYIKRWYKINRGTDIHVYAYVIWAGLCLLVLPGWVVLNRFMLRMFLSYHGWMYLERGQKSIIAYIWQVCLKGLLFGVSPRLYSFQGSLPFLPLPHLIDTMQRYLASMEPILSKEEYMRYKRMTIDFQYGIGQRLQFYLFLKYLFTPNYVSDWWEKYVYLYGRSPLAINSNFYAMDSIVKINRTQVARAANLTYLLLKHMRSIDRGELKPIILQDIVPLCSHQYKRQFNTTRIPNEHCDQLEQYHNSHWIAVYHKGRYFSLNYCPVKGFLSPVELQHQFQMILDDTSLPQPGEENLAALTATDRDTWARAREKYFSFGRNKSSLDKIEKASFVVILANEEYCDDINDAERLSQYAKSLLCGNGNNRWFDKSFNLIIGTNGICGLNVEHSWADAPITGHLCEYVMGNDYLFSKKSDGVSGYNDEGKCIGYIKNPVPKPKRIMFDLDQSLQNLIEESFVSVKKAISDLDIFISNHNQFGKGLIKKCKTSPDAFIQMALQLAYYRDSGSLCLTYEASMTRLFKDGRTETVRSCTSQAKDFVYAMQDPNSTNAIRKSLFQKACSNHVNLYRDAMTGKGVDRHMFCLYIVSKYLEIDCPLLEAAFKDHTWLLSTSQSPTNQTNIVNPNDHAEGFSPGGGFGPVADDGYGVSYIICGEDKIFFHVSSLNSSGKTNSRMFANRITQSMADIKSLFI